MTTTKVSIGLLSLCIILMAAFIAAVAAPVR